MVDVDAISYLCEHNLKLGPKKKFISDSKHSIFYIFLHVLRIFKFSTNP